MKSQHIFTYTVIYLLMAIGIFPSCRKNALDLVPEAQLSTTNFWKTEADVQSGLSACYSFFRANEGTWAVNPTGLRYPSSWDPLSDDAYSYYDYGAAATIGVSGMTPNTGGFVYNAYLNDYQAIAAINDFLDNQVKVTLSDASRNKYVGEARMLRAFYYFELAHLYGNVVLLKTSAASTYKDAVKNTAKDSVLLFVNEDLDSAIADLPDIVYTDGHAVQASARALKARVLLYQGQYAAAAAMAKTVIDEGLFSLSGDYKGLFYKPTQTSNTEILFSVTHSGATNGYPTYGIDITQGLWQGVQPTADLVNEYECTDGLPISSSPLYSASAPYSNRDPRLRMTIFVSGDSVAEGWNLYNGYPTFIPFSGINTTGFAGRKYMDPSISNPQYGTISTQDFVLIRYAEVLLDYAEAENEANGPANAYAAVNQVRARAGVNMPPLPSGITQDSMRTLIRHEKRVEFALEGFRYYDLRRWGIALQKLNGFVIVPGNTSLKSKIYKSYFDLWPLPQTDINRDPALVQNPGY